MNSSKIRVLVLWIRFLVIAVLIVSSSNRISIAAKAPGNSAPLELVQTIPLPGITGGMNHLDADAKRQRFFVTAPGQQKVLVVDLKSGKPLRELGVPAAAARYLPDLDELCVAGHSGVTFFDGETLEAKGKVDIGGSVDELQYDPADKKLFVGVTDSKKPAIAVIDAPQQKLLALIELPAAPQGFVLEMKGKRLFANTPGQAQVTIVDRQQQSVVGEWRLEGARSNYPIALDEAHGRLFVATRRPAKLFAVDSNSGKIVGSVEIGGDADDMGFDPNSHRIYVICGSGVISVAEEASPNKYEKLSDVVTVEDVRNAQFIGPLNALYVAVPPHDGKSAELREYKPIAAVSGTEQTR